MSHIRLIGMTGLAGSGKSEVAKILEKSREATTVSFAAPLKMMLSILVPAGTLKTDRPPVLCGKTYREALQTLGTDWGRDMIGKDIWCNAAMMAIDRIHKLDPDHLVIIDDVRFDNEAELIVQKGGIVIGIERPNLVAMQHASEAGVSDHLKVGTIHNNGTVQELEEAVLNLLSRHKAELNRDALDSEVLTILENRHKWKLKWLEPWPACGPEGNPLDAHVEMSATIHDCINLQRQNHSCRDLPTSGNDAELLMEFWSVHHACIEKK